VRPSASAIPFMIKLWWKKSPVEIEPPVPRRANFAASIAKSDNNPIKKKSYSYPIQPPKLPKGVVPTGQLAPVMAMDSGGEYGNNYSFALGSGYNGFPGYQYLATLATRAEYRNFATSLSTEITREWIELKSSETAGDDTKKKITELTKALDDYGIQRIVQRAAEHDAYFGRAQIFVDIKGHDRSTPLILDKRTIPKGSKVSFMTVEPMWTTPNSYNALDPANPAFYKPVSWWMLGQNVHSSRFATIVTRELPDLLKPAFNFSGMSLSQLAEFYVDEWLNTKTSVSKLLSNFSITALQTNMAQVLSDPLDDGMSLINRAKLFAANRDNQGLMLLDKDTEQLVQVNTPLSGLHELQAQAQEHMSLPSREPQVLLSGISPAGLNASSDGEIRVWNDWIAAQQKAFYFAPILLILKVLQLSMYGEIDDDITFDFEPLYQMTPKELAEIRNYDATAAAIYITNQVISPEEQREQLARDPNSGYQGLQMLEEIEE
jgi:phage-related protein (TIGR01555 family)